MSENRSAEDKILAILEKIKEQYDVGSKTPTVPVPMGRDDVRKAIEVRFTTGFLITECGVSYQEFKKILGKLKEDGVILERSGTDIPEIRIWLNADFDEQYKRYRTQLGDKRTERKLEIVADAQERAARDLSIVSGQLDVFASQFSLVAAIHEDIKRNGVAELIARDIEERQKVFQALTRSMTPILDVARDAQRTIEALGIGKSLEQLREPIEQLNVSASEIVKVVDSVQISMYPPVGEIVLPPPKKKNAPTPALTTSDTTSITVVSAQLGELIVIAREISNKLPPRGGDKKHGYPYTLPAGTRWESIYIAFADDQMVDIRVAGKVHRTGYADMGFADQRTGNPNSQWGLLRILAKYGGELKASDAEAAPKLVKQKEALSQRLKDYFSLDTDPFQPYAQAKGYKTKFTLAPSQGQAAAPTASFEDDDKAYYEELTREE